jgi:hypothetical protein
MVPSLGQRVPHRAVLPAHRQHTRRVVGRGQVVAVGADDLDAAPPHQQRAKLPRHQRAREARGALDRHHANAVILDSVKHGGEPERRSTGSAPETAAS